MTLYKVQRLSQAHYSSFHAFRMLRVCFPVVQEVKSTGHCLFGTAQLTSKMGSEPHQGVFTPINSPAFRGWQLGKRISRAPRDVCFVGDVHIS